MYEGYVASFGRPFCFGRPSEKELTLLKLGLEANRMTHSLVKPGARACDIANQVHGFVRESGFGEYIVYGPGHGTGMMECEYPFIESISDYELQPRMTFAVDTFLGGPGSACAMRTPPPSRRTARSSCPALSRRSSSCSRAKWTLTGPPANAAV